MYRRAVRDLHLISSEGLWREMAIGLEHELSAAKWELAAETEALIDGGGGLPAGPVTGPLTREQRQVLVRWGGHLIELAAVFKDNVDTISHLAQAALRVVAAREGRITVDRQHDPTVRRTALIEAMAEVPPPARTPAGERNARIRAALGPVLTAANISRSEVDLDADFADSNGDAVRNLQANLGAVASGAGPLRLLVELANRDLTLRDNNIVFARRIASILAAHGLDGPLVELVVRWPGEQRASWETYRFGRMAPVPDPPQIGRDRELSWVLYEWFLARAAEEAHAAAAAAQERWGEAKRALNESLRTPSAMPEQLSGAVAQAQHAQDVAAALAGAAMTLAGLSVAVADMHLASEGLSAGHESAMARGFSERRWAAAWAKYDRVRSDMAERLGAAAAEVRRAEQTRASEVDGIHLAKARTVLGIWKHAGVAEGRMTAGLVALGQTRADRGADTDLPSGAVGTGSSLAARRRRLPPGRLIIAQRPQLEVGEPQGRRDDAVARDQGAAMVADTRAEAETALAELRAAVEAHGISRESARAEGQGVPAGLQSRLEAAEALYASARVWVRIRHAHAGAARRAEAARAAAVRTEADAQQALDIIEPSVAPGLPQDRMEPVERALRELKIAVTDVQALSAYAQEEAEVWAAAERAAQELVAAVPEIGDLVTWITWHGEHYQGADEPDISVSYDPPRPWTRASGEPGEVIKVRAFGMEPHGLEDFALAVLYGVHRADPGSDPAGSGRPWRGTRPRRCWPWTDG